MFYLDDKVSIYFEKPSVHLGCSMLKLPITYLRMPLRVSSRKKTFCIPVLDRIESRLAIWKSKLLSDAGRLQLIRLVPNNLPTYYLSMFSICNSLVKPSFLYKRKFSRVVMTQDVSWLQLLGLMWKVQRSMGG